MYDDENGEMEKYQKSQWAVKGRKWKERVEEWENVV